VTTSSPPVASLGQPALEAMLCAGSVAVVGATPRRPSVGNRVMTELLGGGFEGRVVAVNPNHPKVEGLATVPSLLEADPVDLAVLAVADERLESRLADAVAAGARAAAIFSPAQGFAADGAPLRSRLAEIAAEAGMTLCGPNGMGFVNLDHRLRITGFYQPLDLEPGGVTFLSHSGSLFSAMLHNRRGLRFNLVVSTGQEIVTTMADYLLHALSLPTTRVVGLFMETVRNPASMDRALTLAAEQDTPVVALKVGRTERGRAAAATHSGAMAGEDAAYDAFFRAHGVHRVDSIDEMADTLELLAASRPQRAGHLAAVLDSGGERTLLIDSAHQVGVELARLSSDTRATLSTVLEPGLEPDNPVDAWGTGHSHEEIFETSLRALADDPAVGLVAFCVDLTAEEDPADGYLDVISRVVGRLPVPFVVLANLTSAIDPPQAAAVRKMGVPLLEGTRTGLEAIRHLLDRANRPPTPDPVPAGPAEKVQQRWTQRLAHPTPLTEEESLDLVADYGISVVARAAARSGRDAVEVAQRIGYPVALKTAAVAHKSDVGGVHLDLNDPEAVETAYRHLSGRLGPEVLVQAMAPPGIELALGIAVDPQFGPLVLVGAGGVRVEQAMDRVLAVPPFGAAEARRLLEVLAVSRLLTPTRHLPGADIEALAEAVSRLSVLAAQLGPRLAGLDINPVVASAAGAWAVDALAIPGTTR
jgi:acetate---CoA ligase (ADP-forming)